MSYLPFDWYETPLYYDIVFDEDTRKEVAFLEALHKRHVRKPTHRLLEPDALNHLRRVAEVLRPAQ